MTVCCSGWIGIQPGQQTDLAGIDIVMDFFSIADMYIDVECSDSHYQQAFFSLPVCPD